jgi:hypothetical protein
LGCCQAGQLAGQQEIPPESVLDVYFVSYHPKVIDIVKQDDFHVALLQALLASCGREGQKSNIAGSLDRGAKLPLVLGTGAGNSPGDDLTAFRDEVS